MQALNAQAKGLTTVCKDVSSLERDWSHPVHRRSNPQFAAPLGCDADPANLSGKADREGSPRRTSSVVIFALLLSGTPPCPLLLCSPPR